MAGKLEIQLARGLAGKRKKHKESVYALGLKRTGQTVERPDTPEIRGQIRKVSYLLNVKEVG